MYHKYLTYVKVCVCVFVYQTLESAFLQLCEDSDQVGSQDRSQGPVCCKSLSPDSLRDDCREPILGNDVSSTSDIPKPTGSLKTLGEKNKQHFLKIALLC